VKRIVKQRLENCKRRIERRLQWRGRDVPKAQWGCGSKTVMSDAGTHYELSERSRGMVYGGIGLMHRVACRSGLVRAIDQRLHLLKVHMPYRESDHVLNFAFNALCEGTCLEDIELRRNDECFLDAVGAETIPDPTTAGDFCRRFTVGSLYTLMAAINEARLNIWRQQPEKFFEEAVIEMDGTLVITTGECKEGMDMSYKGTWSYHPLIVSLANTGEVLSLVNRPGNRPSEEGAAAEADRAIALCRQGGFRKIKLRGDTAFSQTKHLDRWDADGIVFQFGYDATPNLKEIADKLSESAWEKLERPPAWEVKTKPRARPPRVKRRMQPFTPRERVMGWVGG
jgi:hypothetical protein